MPAYGVIYLITNLVNGKVYVGQTTRAFRDRWGEHVYGQKGCKQAIRRAIIKYGAENFSFAVIGDAANRDALDNLEKLWIILLASSNKMYGYNVTTGGKGFRHTSETIEKIRQASAGRQYISRRGLPNHFRGRTHSLEARHKMSLKVAGERHPNWGKPLSEETKRKISAAAKARSTEQIRELGRKSRGVPKSAEARKKMSDAKKAYFAAHPEVARDRVERMAMARLGGPSAS